MTMMDRGERDAGGEQASGRDALHQAVDGVGGLPAGSGESSAGEVEECFDHWPGEVVTHDLIGNEPLTLEQAQRRDALYAAGTVLERRGPMGTVTPAGVPDIVRLANFIIDGEAGL